MWWHILILFPVIDRNKSCLLTWHILLLISHDGSITLDDKVDSVKVAFFSFLIETDWDESFLLQTLAKLLSSKYSLIIAL